MTEKQKVSLLIVQKLTSEMNKRDEALKKVPQNVSEILNSLQTSINKNGDRIDILMSEIRTKANKG